MNIQFHSRLSHSAAAVQVGFQGFLLFLTKSEKDITRKLFCRLLRYSCQQYIQIQVPVTGEVLSILPLETLKCPDGVLRLLIRLILMDKRMSIPDAYLQKYIKLPGQSV